MAARNTVDVEDRIRFPTGAFFQTLRESRQFEA